MTDDRRSRRRLARALAFLHQNSILITSAHVRARLERLFLVGRAMDFARRMREHGDALTPELALRYAEFAGVGEQELVFIVLPRLKAAGVIGYQVTQGRLTHIEEYVGVGAPVLDQVSNMLTAMDPSEAEWATLHSIELGSWAPLAARDHKQSLSARGFRDEVVADGFQLGLASGVNKRAPSSELNEAVIFNPYVWGTGHVKIARFLHGLPSDQRESLLGLAEQASDRPGIALPALGPVESQVLTAARKVGLLQAATVKSTAAGQANQTYIFSPLVDAADDRLVTTEALHERKLFVAHMMFAHERAIAGRGRVRDPVVLVNRLLDRGYVGPASNIASDYHLVEAAGIVRVEETPQGPYLHVVRREIVESGLDWLRQTFGVEEDPRAPLSLGALRPPQDFLSPERDRAALPDDAAAGELADAAIHDLRKEAQRAARGEQGPF